MAAFDLRPVLCGLYTAFTKLQIYAVHVPPAVQSVDACHYTITRVNVQMFQQKSRFICHNYHMDELFRFNQLHYHLLVAAHLEML